MLKKPLRQRQIIDSSLRGLPAHSPLERGGTEGLFVFCPEVTGCVSSIKKACSSSKRPGDIFKKRPLPAGGTALFIILILMAAFFSFGDDLHNRKIQQILFSFNGQPDVKKARKFELLLDLKKGDPFNHKKIRQSMENLYKAGPFNDIEIRIEQLPQNLLNVYFNITCKPIVDSILLSKNNKIDKKELLNSLYSLRTGAYFEENKIEAALKEIKNFLESRGYLNSKAAYTVSQNKAKHSVGLVLFITPGRQAKINKVIFSLPESISYKKLLGQIKPHFKVGKYLPYTFPQKIEKIKKLLKKQKYYYPEIEIKPVFLDKEKTAVNLEINVDPGYKYIFKFRGMKNKIDLISSIWGKKRFEKWAIKESNARILYFLRNNGFLNAEIESGLEIKGREKHLTFTVQKNKKHTLGSINFSGNKSIPEKELRQVIKTDDQVFNSLFWLRISSLYIDQGVLEQFYHFHGFPLAEITMQFNLQETKADIDFLIAEKEKFTVESILFDGSKFFDREKLLSFMKTIENGPFVHQVLNRDIETLIGVYYASGFDNVQITPEISPGTEKPIFIRIREGKPYKMGNLVIIGASSDQEKLLKKLFPLKMNSPFNRSRIARFKDETENSGIFSEVKISQITKSADTIDVLLRITPDRSKYYGLGIGWEDRKGLRGTVEYQEKNIFNSSSSFSAMVQAGIKEKRGLISYDTPYFFKNKINSSLKIWADNEIYPSYSFNRYGIAESLVRKLTPTSYILGSFSWYRTELTELEPPEYGVDAIGRPFDTTAFNFSYVLERRDDPFNPKQGDYFSSDIKVGFPLFEKSYSFIKFLWSYQRNFKFLKYGTLSFSVRNGFASGDMSITERFFAGGVHSFRGTKIDRLGPIDAVNDAPKGGNALVLVNLEATFPVLIVPVKDLYYSVFFDMGNVFEKVNDFDMSQLKKALGFSIKIKTQMGPIRVDFGWNLQERPEGSFEWNIGIGNVF